MQLGSTINGEFVDEARRERTKTKTVRAVDGDTVSMQMYSTRTETVGLSGFGFRSIHGVGLCDKTRRLLA